MWYYYCYDICRVQAVSVSSYFGFLELSCIWLKAGSCVSVWGAGVSPGASGCGLQIDKRL